jgi:hypothetical protein
LRFSVAVSLGRSFLKKLLRLLEGMVVLDDAGSARGGADLRCGRGGPRREDHGRSGAEREMKKALAATR